MGVVEGVDPRELSEAGWGVVFADDSDPAILDALKPLLDLRRSQAGRDKEHYYKEFVGKAQVDPRRPSGYREGESKQQFLARHGAGPGPADPERVPYYLMIVGDPGVIPFRFQYQLDVQYAVGRLYFDSVEEYARYAEGVVRAETGAFGARRRASFFAPVHPGDPPSRLTLDRLVWPLAERLMTARPEWEIRMAFGSAATKDQLRAWMTGPDAPALLFTASHGMVLPAGHPDQGLLQGSLICQDWPGPGRRARSVTPHEYYAAVDVGDGIGSAARIVVHYASFGGGTDRRDEVIGRGVEVATRSFVAPLARALLEHPRGGALAVVAQSGRAWGYSSPWSGWEAQLAAFQATLMDLMDGSPVGAATESLNQECAKLSRALDAELDCLQFGRTPELDTAGGLWAFRNDVQNFIVIGDPAVRL